MDLLLYVGMLAASLFALIKGADFFVDAAERIGLSFGISPFIIGVTIIAFGTSLPELASSIASIYKGTSEIVLSGVIGSNITNVTLVLATVAVIGKSVPLNKNILNVDIPLLLISIVLLWYIVSDGNVMIIEAVLLLIALVIFLVYSLQAGGDDSEEIRVKIATKDYLLLLAGGVLVYLGAEYTIEAINKISAIVGINQDIVGLTILALATSLPELIVSIAAARKGKTEIAVGNVIGSNIFNTYAVVGIARLFGELKMTDAILSFSLPFAVAITVLLAFSCLSKSISRWEGLMFLMLYAFFILELSKGVL